MIMVIKIELKIVDQIGTSVCLWPKKVKCWNFEGDCVLNGSTGKVATWGFLLIHEMTFLDKMQIFFKEWSVSSLNNILMSESIFTILSAVAN